MDPLHQRKVVACQNVEFFLEKTSKNFKNDQKNRGNQKHAVQPLHRRLLGVLKSKNNAKAVS
jgi:hypothetical protein